MPLQDGDRDRETLRHRRPRGGRRAADRPGRGRSAARVAGLLRPAEEFDRAQPVPLAVGEHEILIANQPKERLGQRHVVELRRDVARLARRALDLRAADPPELGKHVFERHLLEAHRELVASIRHDGWRRLGDGGRRTRAERRRREEHDCRSCSPRHRVEGSDGLSAPQYRRGGAPRSAGGEGARAGEAARRPIPQGRKCPCRLLDEARQAGAVALRTGQGLLRPAINHCRALALSDRCQSKSTLPASTSTRVRLRRDAAIRRD